MAESPLWTPGAARQENSRLSGYLRRRGFDSYDEAWRWSTDRQTAGEFWSDVAAELAVRWHQPPVGALEPGANFSEARWFPEGRLNYAEAALSAGVTTPDAAAVVARSETRDPQDLTWSELREVVSRVRAGLIRAGVTSGDRVAGYLPNIPEALAAMLAAASLGAVWTCCAPEMGVAGVLDRLGQVEPVVLVACDGYRYGGKRVDRAGHAEQIRQGLPSVRRPVWLGYLAPDREPPAGWDSWADLTSDAGPLEFASCAFDQPLYILFSSGTTGQPKPIVHGHGGILLEHGKALGWHFDLAAGDRFFWYTTTGWMMWNFLVSGLLVGAAVVTYDGAPSDLWSLMAATGVVVGGVSAGYLANEAKAGRRPGRDHDLSGLLTLGSTGSPLSPVAARWVYQAVADDVMLGSFSGGTDVCTGFVGPSPLHPAWAGEISCRCLGARVEVFDDTGLSVVGKEGELVLTAPLPSMPVGFWGDAGGHRYRAAYFDRFPGVWAHGDRATLSERGTVIITGRSDGTLNRGGVRMGTAEFYSVVEALDGVADSLVVHLTEPDELWLFVVPAAGGPTEGWDDRVREALRQDLSPRHIPDRIQMVTEVPRTLSGKKLEVPVKRILSGTSVDEALTVASVANPESLAPFVALARSRAAGDQPS
jgi:acetoacetyl-CoA synthetase